MHTNIDIFQRIKFSLWHYSKRNPVLGFPIKIAGKIFTYNFMNSYKNKIKKIGMDILPLERYKREISVPKQFYIIISKHSNNLAVRSIEILLNHFRIPFSIIDLTKNNEAILNKLEECSVLIGCKLDSNDIINIKKKLSDKLFKLIIFSSINEMYDKYPEVYFISNKPEEMMPFNLGLRSKVVEKFTDIILSSKFPIITGFLPPQVALRIDDVKGYKIKNYIQDIINYEWRPNLGLFLDDFEFDKYISSLNKNKKIDFSPHAYNDKKFIFFNYPNNTPFSNNDFKLNWEIVEKKFLEFGLEISPVVNAHFHAFSNENFEIFEKKGIKYIFSELSPSKIYVTPNNYYLPSGDPINTTGQLTEKNIYQIYSGDSVLNCNQKNSKYDFLMHIKNGNKTNSAIDCIKERINISLNTGFASFFTTHEYLINKLSSNELAYIFSQIEIFINKHKLKPIKTNLTDIGRTCENHTNIIINSIEIKNDKFIVNLKGKSNGNFFLCTFGNGKINKIEFQSFIGEKRIEILK